MENNAHKFVHTNLYVFYQIAQEAYIAMNADLNSSKKPKSDNESGRVVAYDPKRKSFKNAFITIVFCGIFLESLLHLLIVDRKGIEFYEKYDRESYGKKLVLLGCEDKSILEGCEHYRKVRKEAVHEKAHINNKNIRVAQKEANTAFELTQQIVLYFNLKMD